MGMCAYCGLDKDEGITRCADCGASDDDYPWTFYFNGEEMPRWTSEWLVIPNDHREGEDNDWIEDLFWRVWCRIDHLGSIETEDSDLLRGCVLQAMRWLVEREKEVRVNISELFERVKKRSPNISLAEYKTEDVLESLFLGLNKMLDLSHKRKISCWTNGYPKDQQRLVEFMAESHELYPHQQRRLQELEVRSSGELKRLRQIASTRKLPERIRAAILERKPCHD